MLFDKSTSWRHIFTHKHGKHVLGPSNIWKRYADKCSLCWIHCCLPKLFGVHLAQALVALNFYVFPSMSSERIDKLFQCVNRLFRAIVLDQRKERLLLYYKVGIKRQTDCFKLVVKR